MTVANTYIRGTSEVHRYIHLFLLELCTSTYSVHACITKPCGGRHPWLLVVFLRLLSSLVWAQLTPFVPASGIWPLLPQYGYPIHRVRAHSLTGIRNRYNYLDFIVFFLSLKNYVFALSILDIMYYFCWCYPYWKYLFDVIMCYLIFVGCLLS